MRRQIELILFDCDGVLLDSEIVAAEVEVAELERCGYFMALDQFLQIALGNRSDEVERRLADDFNMRLPANFWDNVAANLKIAFETNLRPIAGAAEALGKITIPKCVASNSSLSRLEHSLTITQLFPYFKGNIFHGGLVERGKPHPDLFLTAAKKLNVPVDSCLVIEDSVAGVQAAISAGMHVFGFAGGSHILEYHPGRLLQAGAEIVFKDMSLLPYIVGSEVEARR